MPIPLPRQPRNQAVAAIESADWLVLWALSLGFAAALIALFADLSDDQIGAASVLTGAAAIIAIVLRMTRPKSERD